jgi:O-antigen/teichoic acid export membrane protein
LRGFVGRTALYGLGELLPRAVGFLLLPLYTHFLRVEDYGLLAVLDMVGVYFGIVVNAGFSSALIRYHHEHESEDWRRRVFVTSVSVALALGVLGVVLLAPFAGSASEWIFDTRSYGPYLIAILATVALEVANNLVLTLFRVREDADWYLRDTVLRLLLAVPMNVYFIAVLGMGILGFVLSNLLTAVALFSTIGLTFLWRNRARPDPGLARELFRFAAPFVPVGFVEAFLNQLGVLCLTMTGNLTLVGLFGVGQKLGSIVSYAYSPIGASWIPHMYKVARSDDAPRIYARGATWIVALLGWLVVALACLADLLVRAMTPESYEGAAAVVLPLAVGALFFSLRPAIRIGIGLRNRTGLLPLATAAPTALGFPLTLVLAHHHGAVGAAWGVAFTAGAVLLVLGVISQRLLRVPYEWSRLARLVSIAGACSAVGLALPRGAPVAAAGAVLAYPLLVVLLGVPTGEERRAVARWVRSWGRGAA